MARVPPGSGRQVNLDFGTSGGPYIDSSGIVPVSGASGAGSGNIAPYESSGPWMIETQSLTIDYARVPTGYFNTATSAVSLSSVVIGDNDYTIGYTVLQVKVAANYKRSKSYTFFNTSSFQQPQKFEIVGVSADAFGRSYGTPNASALGIAGTVYTKQDWYNRKPWATIDSEYASSITNVYNFVTSQFDLGDPASSIRDSSKVFGSYEPMLIPACGKGSLIQNYDMAPGLLNGLGWMSQGYKAANDVWNLVIDTINGAGVMVSSERFFPAKPTEAQVVAQPNGWVGIPQYEIWRHDFT